MLCEITEKVNIAMVVSAGFEKFYKMHPIIPDDFKSIQGALNSLQKSSGRTILIRGGIYSECITINDVGNLTIKAVGGKVTILQPKGRSWQSLNCLDTPAVRLTMAYNVSIVGIEIMHACEGNCVTALLLSVFFSLFWP